MVSMLRTVGILAAIGCLFVPNPALQAAVRGPAKKPYVDRPDDKVRQHVQSIRAAAADYIIDMQGTVDGVMTRSPIGYGAYTQGWQPNRSVRIENVGTSDVRNPLLRVNGRGGWRGLAEIADAAAAGYQTESDRARAIWEFWRRKRFHATTWDGESSDAVKALHVYGYTLCGDEAQILNDLWRAAGLTTRRGHPVGHCVTEVFYENSWHLLDSDEHVICLDRDNRSIVSEAEVVADHDLLKRTHTYGILQGDSRQTDEFSASLYGYEGERKSQAAVFARHVMDLTLRPQESIEFRWDHLGKQYTAGQAVAKGQKLRDGLGDLLAGWGEAAYDHLRNGKLRYRPDFKSPAGPRGATLTNVRVARPAGILYAQHSASPASLVWRFASPYVFVGGKATAQVRLGAGASAQWRFSTDGKAWTTLAHRRGTAEEPLVAELDSHLSPRARPDYVFYLELVLEGSAAASQPEFEHDIQTSNLALPELTVGKNRVEYTHSTTGDCQMQVTHRWLDRTGWHPPSPPAEALAPRDGQVVAGSEVRFQWSAAGDPDRETIADYHFELSEHADFRWPLSPNFEKLISRTASRGKAEWTLPAPGLLNPNTDYYWRVRACDAAGVWGKWSPAFRFRVRAPAAPRDLQIAADGPGALRLSWKPDSRGEPPVAYKVYGSDERGFSIGDGDHRVLRGKGFVGSLEEFDRKPAGAPDCGMVETPGNLLGVVKETSVRVVGADLSSPNANKCYYRVVAVDAAGQASGPSNPATAPRLFIYSNPPAATVGKPYRYQPLALRSLGDLRCRPTPASSYNAAFWDRDRLRWTAVELPDGLAIDPASGVVSGTPTRSAQQTMAIAVSNQAGLRWEQRVTLGVATTSQSTSAISAPADEPVAVRAENFVVLPSSQPLAMVAVKNPGAAPFTGKLSVRGPEGWQITPSEVPVTLKAGEFRRVPFTVQRGINRSDNRYPLEITLVGPSGEVKRRQEVVCASAPYFKPTIDGDPSDWQDAIPIAFATRNKTTTLRTYWNRQQFCLLAAVEEDRLESFSPTAPRFDALQLALGARDSFTGSSPEDLAARHEFLLVATGNGAEGKCFYLAAPQTKLAETQQERPLAGLLLDKAAVAVTRKGAITFYECAIPFAIMRQEIRPGEGREFCLSLLVHDPDGTGLRDWGQSAGLWPSQRTRLAWSRWPGALWPAQAPFDNKIEWGLCSSKY